MYTHEKNILIQGKPLSEASKALIMVHGRGATASSILTLASELEVEAFSLFAPQATNHSWYPHGFMAPISQNQPALDSALDLLSETLAKVKSQGIADENIFLLGFSQGACLTAEFAALNARRYGGLILFTGGLIGETIDIKNYQGDFAGTPVLITTGSSDPHVPVSRVEETVAILIEKGAKVIRKIYAGRPHTILPQELALARQILIGSAES